ncbi:OapB/ArvB family protein [Methanobrevibacter curvatus]|uniref:DUF2073 domain-containing protein n=1 Tax=Methanobrevibacter curvatus TaxID=49547 RepID=A0A166AQY2_9EURY|nr:DUF2073 domain-containing protein [Methanobrevibacter curvatus]KZX12361.1 hypothetical protein MBCUR_10530 [Methanobrevibacter curvatus]
MEGLKLDFISFEAIENATSMEKIYMIIERVKDGSVVVMEGGLSPAERTELIETTMREIDIEKFVGIDVHTLEKDAKALFGLKRKKQVVITIVGPANVMQTVKKQSNLLSVVAKLDNS